MGDRASPIVSHFVAYPQLIHRLMHSSAQTPVLTPQQAVAFDTLKPFLLGKTEYAMALLRGYAGTGKTFLVGRLLAELRDRGLRIAVAAPTNKAVQVLREKIVNAGCTVAEEPLDGFELDQGRLIEFGSIHSLLGLRLVEREDGSQHCRQGPRGSLLHRYHAVVVDECSMIDDKMLEHIILAKRGTRILFVGDSAQLPPVSDALGRASPTFERISLQVSLSEIVRQAADNPIIALGTVIRRATEEGRAIGLADIAAAVPPLHEHPRAALVHGDAGTLASFALYELRAGRDARVLAFTNQAVQHYNRVIHEQLHGVTKYPFVVGQQVLAHAQCDAQVMEGRSAGSAKTVLITNEEATVLEVSDEGCPAWPDIPAHRIVLEREDGQRVRVYVPNCQEAHERAVASGFSDWRKLKAQADQAGDRRLALALNEQAQAASALAWSLRRSFAPLRHTYAMTVHKSQGSTFDTAILDLRDLLRMRSVFEFNRALYVAVTRPSQYLALVA